MIPDTPAFRRWAGTNAPILENDDLVDYDWTQPGPVLVRAFHGTTHDFQAFSLERNTHAGHFGKVHYFTSCKEDAHENYANENGIDLQKRIDLETENLIDAIEEYPAGAGLPEDADDDMIYKRAREHARELLVGPSPHVLDLCLRLNRPFVIDAIDQVKIPLCDEQFGMSDATQMVADDLGISLEEVEADWETHEDAIYEALDAAQVDILEKLTQAFSMASVEVGVETPNIPYFPTPISEMSCRDFKFYFDDDHDASYIMNDDGDFVSSTFLSSVLEHMGYDSIVLLNADRQFRSMTMNPGTTHIHLMGSARTQVKSLQNSGVFSPDNPNIYM